MSRVLITTSLMISNPNFLSDSFFSLLSIFTPSTNISSFSSLSMALLSFLSTIYTFILIKSIIQKIPLYNCIRHLKL